MNILFIIFKGQPKPIIQYHSSTLLLFFIIFLLSPLYSSHPLLVKAQNFATLDSDSDPYFTAGIALTAIAVISFSVYIVIYLCFRRFFQPWAERNRDHPSHTGIDPLILRTFPVINFTDHILDLKPSKGLAECAVCLGLFERGETLRVLPKCGHVFHVGCVDPWLASHTTCPLCRANLVLGSDELAQVESGCVAGLGCEVVEVNEVDDNNVVVPMSREVVGVQPGSIWRWNSTGHVARFDGMKDEEKSTVVRKDIIVRRELNRTKSCTIINMDLDDS